MTGSTSSSSRLAVGLHISVSVINSAEPDCPSLMFADRCSSILDHGTGDISPSLCKSDLSARMRRATAHHASSQLPTLWFAVLMIGHMLDTFLFQSSKRSNRAKWIWFGLFAGSVFVCFMWFRGVAFGITGPIKDHTGLRWRKVSGGQTIRPLVCKLIVICLTTPWQTWNVSNLSLGAAR